jgi:GH15 family glucan-1,4-alpha-glucosidase
VKGAIATGSERTRPLWGVVMSLSAFGAIPPDDPAAVKTLRFLQTNLYGGLHLNLGYSRGVWPYLSAEVALWHLRLGEAEEAWRILRAIVDRASSTVCWYEEIEHQPPCGHGDPADMWAAAETVYLAHQLVLTGQATQSNNK